MSGYLETPLMAAIALLAVVCWIWAIIDAVRNVSRGPSDVAILMVVLIGGPCVGIPYVVGTRIGRMSAGPARRPRD